MAYGKETRTKKARCDLQSHRANLCPALETKSLWRYNLPRHRPLKHRPRPRPPQHIPLRLPMGMR